MRLTKSQQANFDAGTDFQRAVWSAIAAIPRGRVITYKALAEKINRPKAFRAVAGACGANPCAPTIPCHRVVASGGKIGGFSSPEGVAKKIRLLEKEGVDTTRLADFSLA